MVRRRPDLGTGRPVDHRRRDAPGLHLDQVRHVDPHRARGSVRRSRCRSGDFVAAHGGDGPGLYALTFGCDGAPFSMDAMRVGSPGNVKTYDLEGIDDLAGDLRGTARRAPGRGGHARGAT